MRVMERLMLTSVYAENSTARKRIRTARVFLLALVAIIAVSWFTTSAAIRPAEQELEKLNRFVQASNASDEAAKAFREARDYIKDREWVKAEQTFRSLITDHPKHKDADAALYYLAYALKQQNRFPEADKTLERLIKEYPASSWMNDARAMRIEMAPRLKNNETINEAINEEDEELKLAALQSLFESSPERAIKVAFDVLRRGSRSSIALKEGAITLLADSESAEAGVVVIEIARNETDARLRRKAVEALGEVDGPGVVDLLKELATKSTDRELARAAMRSLAEHKGPQSHLILIEIARSSADMELRTIAISELGDEGDESTVDELVRLFEAEKNQEVREHILSALSQSDSPRARAKILEIARSGADIEIRKAAISLIGDNEDGQAADNLIRLYDAERDQEVKEEIISALGGIENKRALRKLMEIVKSDATARLKRRAIEELGDSEDPEAAKFLEDLLRKSN
jgi:HEAT repeat protein